MATLIVPLDMSPMEYYAAIGVTLSIAAAVVVWMLWMTFAMPAPARQPVPMRKLRRSNVVGFLGECFFWSCVAFYALVIAAAVVGVLSILWLWLV